MTLTTIIYPEKPSPNRLIKPDIALMSKAVLAGSCQPKVATTKKEKKKKRQRKCGVQFAAYVDNGPTRSVGQLDTEAFLWPGAHA